MARPNLIDEPTVATLLRVMRQTMRHTLAADAAGISRETMRRWLRRGETGEEPYATVRRKMMKAKAERQAELIAKLDAHGESQWPALAWQLERTAPEEFGMVSALRKAEDSDLATTSRESRMAQLREAFQTVQGDDAND
jgi:transposase